MRTWRCNILSRTTSVNASPYQNSTYLVDQANKHLYKKSELLSEIAFPKISCNIPQKMFMMESRYNKVTSFPRFSFEQSTYSVDHIQITSSDL